MAVVTSSDLKIKQDLLYGSFYERILDKTNIFNQDSLGCINLSSSVLTPGFLQEQAFLKNFDAGVASDRDPDSVADGTEYDVSEDSTNKFKIFRKLGILAWLESAYYLKGVSPEQRSLRIGERMADLVLHYFVQLSIAALTTCIEKNSSAVVAVAGALNHKNILELLRLRGDNFGRGRLLVMDSKAYLDLVGQSIDLKVNDPTSLAIRTGTTSTFGIPTLVLDNDDLRVLTSNVRSHTKVLLLNQGAISIEQGPIRQVNERKGGGENIKQTWQGEYDADVEVDGFAWSSAEGDRKPNLAALRTAGKWTWKFANVHDGPGYRAQFTDS